MQPKLESNTSNEISLYYDEIANPSDIAKEVQLLTVAFPEITPQFTAVLMNRIFANNFTKQRIHDAISHVLDTFQYKNINIADIISFDRKIQTYSYSEMVVKCDQYKTTENFEIIQINGKKRWFEK